jgi:hypothetical protein
MGKLITLYPHRHNKDGSFDSICPICFATVVFGKAEVELAQYDKKHVCDPAILSDRACFIPPHSSRSDTHHADVLPFAQNVHCLGDSATYARLPSGTTPLGKGHLNGRAPNTCI